MRASALKYGSKAVFWNSETRTVLHTYEVDIYRDKGKLKLPKHIWRFDSQHEFNVYVELTRMYGENRILRQEPVTVISPGWCFPKGKQWKVDFVVVPSEDKGDIDYLVEAKGAFLPEFGWALACLEAEWEYLFLHTKIIFPYSLPKKNKIVKALLNSGFSHNLLTLKDLKAKDRF